MNDQLLNIIVCPICYSKLLLNKKENKLICSIDNIRFSINNGIPILVNKKIDQFFLNSE